MTPEYFEELGKAARKALSGHTEDQPGAFQADKPRTSEEQALADGIVIGLLMAGELWCQSQQEPKQHELVTQGGVYAGDPHYPLVGT